MKKKVLVTGANGQLGKTIAELYSENEVELDFIFASKEILDITDKGILDVFFKDNKLDYCINCAAYTNVEEAEKTPEIAYKINAEGVKNLAEACKIYDVGLVHISTDYVFDGKKEEPYTILDKPNPINEYGKSKLLGEKYVQEILKNYFIVRTSWLYSKKYGHNFYKSVVKWAKEGKDLKITTEQIGCPTDTVNLSSFIVNLIRKRDDNFGIYHYSCKDVMTWYDFARKVLIEKELLGKTKLEKVKKYNTFALRPKNSVLK
ncbi:dTDP-4-dehydrorhamnose reductase [Seonamhaeicola marinus]|uniref:dTDP-4-dehydrorhamnose reductase n=1 Tax=Seonamhaeicola marinus TaxID=1912246 RepID=A0A5D0HS84_9FLAO|nr:dTDP-4-dehydrorhamnose reductase [Seonamhaeicola marinus]TYA74138.1 dTDP-4-dehydrorhamnose reductase [Seonamhaeicola marinus]